MYKNETTVRVRYAETDQMGYVYYGNYAQYYEVGRVEMLRSMGLTYKSIEEEGIMMPVLELYSKYSKPAQYDDELRIVTTMNERPGMRIRFEYEIFKEGPILLNKGYTILVFVNMKTFKPCLPPLSLLEKLQTYFTHGMAT